MSTKTKKRQSKQKPPASIIWFEIPADNVERARKFYNSLFGWKITKFPEMDDYWHIDTGGPDASPDGGMMTRKHPGHSITNYVFVDSVSRSMEKVKKLGGAICMEKTPV